MRVRCAPGLICGKNRVHAATVPETWYRVKGGNGLFCGGECDDSGERHERHLGSVMGEADRLGGRPSEGFGVNAKDAAKVAEVSRTVMCFILSDKFH